MKSPAQHELDAFLDERNSAPDTAGRAAVDDRIRARFLRQRVVIISDMSGFSRITQAEGILHFLGLVRRMQSEIGAIVAVAGGRVIKAEADNLYILFEDPDDALRAVVAMTDFCESEKTRDKNDRIGLSIGIGWGQVLDLDGVEFYGDQVNLASKLGEDIANSGEVLATESFVNALDEHKGWFWERHDTRISNIDLPYFHLHRVR